jgi:mannose-6-phosphate isomerase-like protein (cupin superfamily)
MHVRNTHDTPPVTSPHGEIIHELLGAGAGGTVQHSLACITLPPGVSSRRHYHPTAEESYFILSGTGQLLLDKDTRSLRAGDAAAIPARAVHQITNSGSAPLIFLAVCAPPWTFDCSVFVD